MEIINFENLFLIVLALIWIIGAIFQDLRRREVDNLWNFSLIAFALGYRASISIFGGNYWFLLNGAIGFIIFLGLGNLFYYSRLFAGGDAKLLIALGIILPISYDWLINLKIFGFFIVLLLLGGSIYALFYAFTLVFNNKKEFGKEFTKQWKIYKNLFLFSLIFVIFWVVVMFFINKVFILIGLIFLLFPILLTFSKSVEESCLRKSVSPKEVTEGDWLYEDIFVGGKKIKSKWDGVSRDELELIKRKCKGNVLIKQGIPFTPSFLIALVGLLFLIWKFSWWF